MIRLLAIAALVLPRPADACTGCKPPTEAQLISESVRVYAGKVIAVDKASITVEVDAVWKGTASKQQVFPTTCWFARKVGTQLLVMDRGGKPMYFISECLGVQRDGAQVRARITKLAGTPKTP